MISESAERIFRGREVPYIRPFYCLERKSGQDVLDWIKEADTKLNAYYQPLFTEQKNNLASFLNTIITPNFSSAYVSSFVQQGLFNNTTDNVIVNEMYRVVMDQVSLIVSNELVPQVLPNNQDYKDKISAKITKDWLASMNYDLDIDLQRIKWSIQQKIFGEAFVIPIWDSEKGDLLPESKEYANEELDYVDEDGREVVDELGQTVKVRKYLRQGDIDLKNPMPFDVKIDPKSRFEDSDWFYYIEYEETEYLKKKYKDVQFVETPNSESQKYDAGSNSIKGSSNHTKVFNFFHRSHPFLAEGARIICTENEILLDETLESMPSLIETRSLPLVFFKDLEIGIGVRGFPILFRNLRPVVNGYNKLTNQIYGNLEAESPKILVHESAGMDAQRMETGIVVMEWRGNHKPSIETPVTNNSSIFKFRDDLKQNIIELGMQMPTGRGQTPNAQLDSFIALQHFEDQRIQLAAPDIKQHIKCIEHLYRLLISIGRDNYDPDDGRLIKIVGKNNKFSLRFFDPENLNRSYDIKITTTGNLANSKAARTQLMMTIKREFPTLMQDETFIDMLGLSDSDKFENAITTAVNSAEAENEDMLSGIPVLPPARYEDLITHWDSHRIPMQGQEFKLAPPEVQELFERHMTATEKLMFEQASESQTFAARLANLRQFPMFYTATPTNELKQIMPPVDGQGEELGGVPDVNSVPTEDMETPPFNEAEAPEEIPQDQMNQMNQLSPV